MMRKKVSGIYQIICCTTGRVYIGSAADIHNRWAAHRHYLRREAHQNRFLQRAWKKYGARNFIFKIIEVVPVEMLLVREQHFIDSMKACDPKKGFNLAPFAASSRGVKRSLEYIRALASRITDEQRAALAARNRSEEAKAATSAANKTRKWKAETRAKLAKAAARQYAKPADRAAHGAAVKAAMATPAVREKISAAAKRREQGRRDSAHF